MYWIFWILVIGSLEYCSVIAQNQRVAPGVPPQHYQQPSHGQQMHQVPQQVPQQQFQQVPIQQQQQQQQQVPVQVPMQQVPMQQQVPVQHVPVEQHSHNHDHMHSQQILNTANIAQEKAHIAEHLDVPIDTNKMTDQELQFHYFKMHDADNNNKLDGCELIKSLIHWHEQGNAEPGATNSGEKLFTDEELVSLIDPILAVDDVNRDGFIDYPEFIQAQQKAAAAGH